MFIISDIIQNVVRISFSGYQRFLERHCRQRQYSFQIQKCDDLQCCGPRRYAETFPWLPDPVLSHDHNHYKSFDQVLGQDTTDIDRPSAANKTVTAVAEELQVCNF